MRTMVTVKPVGRINRRDLPHLIGDTEVLSRENMMVIGNGDDKRNRKVSGADRFSDTDTGTSYIWGHRMYMKGEQRKTFAFNSGIIYHISDNGVETSAQTGFISNPHTSPCSEVMRVSGNDILFFSEGVDTGMYSHDGNIENTFTKETGVSLNFVGMLSHLDRMFGFEEDSEDLYFSKNLDPVNFTDATDAGVISIGAKRGSKIMAIALLYGTIYIFKQDSIWRLTGRTPSEFAVEEVHPYLGCAGRRSVANTDNGIIFLGSDFEFYFFGGTIANTIILSYKLAIGGDLTKNLESIINKNKPENVVAIYHNKLYRCSFTETGHVTNNLEYCFNTVNETDFLTRGFNISCYIKWDRHPDKDELLTGRTDLGRLMKHNLGLNLDNGASSPSMLFKLQTKFIGSSELRNTRFKRAYINFGVLGAEKLRMYYFLDCRNAREDAVSDQWVTRGETKALSPTLSISAQSAISSRINLQYGNSKGQNISFMIDHEGRDIDLEIASISVEAITKSTPKLSEKVGV